jgi:hypothetical protein
MIGYKIVKKDGDDLVSTCIIGPLAFTYVPGKWTRKRKYGPMIFPTAADCVQFIRSTFDVEDFELYHIWECKYNEKVKLDSFFYAVELTDITYRTYLRWVDCMNNNRLIKRGEKNSYYYTFPEPRAIVTTQIKLIADTETRVWANE